MTCPACGQDLRPGQMLCQCGAAVGITQPDLGNVGPVNIGMPNLDLGRTQVPTLGLSFPGNAGAAVPNFDLARPPSADIDLQARQEMRGQPFRAVLAVGGTADAAVKLNLPMAVAYLPDRDFLVLDLGDENGSLRIQQFDPEGTLRKVVRKSAGARAAEVPQIPVALAVDRNGHVFVSDMDAGCLQEYDPAGVWVASHGREGIGAGEMNSPRAVAVDAAGSVYVADSGNNRIVRWSEGTQHLVAGINRLDEAEGWLLAGDGPGEFDDPQGLALGLGGQIFVADTNNHRIQVLDSGGRFLKAFGSEGEEAGQFSYPSHVRIKFDGAIMVADLAGRRLQLFNPKGEFSYEIVLPGSMGAVSDFAMDADGRVLLALRGSHVVIGIEVE